jgi:hypothetical protein
VPTKVTGGLSRVPTKMVCIKCVDVSPSTDKQCVGWVRGRYLPQGGCVGTNGSAAVSFK